jgi:hypothetical protein
MEGNVPDTPTIDATGRTAFGGKHTAIRKESQFCGDLLQVLLPDGVAELNSVFADVTTIIVVSSEGERIGTPESKTRLLLVSCAYAGASPLHTVRHLFSRWDKRKFCHFFYTITGKFPLELTQSQNDRSERARTHAHTHRHTESERRGKMNKLQKQRYWFS